MVVPAKLHRKRMARRPTAVPAAGGALPVIGFQSAAAAASSGYAQVAIVPGSDCAARFELSTIHAPMSAVVCMRERVIIIFLGRPHLVGVISYGNHPSSVTPIG